MRTKTSPAILFTVLTLSALCYGQLWSGILDPTRAIDWTKVGVGGIPPRTTVCSTINPNGSADMTGTINSALSSCASGETVALASGTFRVNGNINVPGNVTLRGAGANLTILDVHGSGNGAINLGSGYPSVPGVSVTGGATSGSTSITVSSTSGISVGKYLMITELNDPSYVTIQGGEGNCTWCDGGLGYNGTRVRGQMLEVTSVSGNTVGFDPPLYTAYSGTPLVAPMTAITYAGVENLQVYANNTGYKASFQLSGCAYCWLKGIEANYTDGDFVQVHYGFRDEIRDSYFSNAYQHSAGASDSDIFIVDKTTASLVENNIVERAHVSIMINWGAAGNVIAYNYMMGEFDSGGTNFVIGGIGVHGAHPQFNLIEGNVMNQYYPDQVWGSSAYNTSFRNWTIGTGKACKPLTGRGAVTCSGTNGWYPFQASRAMQIGHLSRYYNFVGNVSGSDAQQAVGSSHVGLLEYSSSRSYDSTNYNFTFGYGESNDSGSGSGCSGGTAPCHSSDAYATAFLHGNYTQADGSINWAAGVTHSLPVSFYLTAKPSWWGSLPWPSIGPDVTGESGAGGHASLSSSNPAMDCYNNQMHGSDGGAGSPLTFNPGNCYGNAQTLAPPTDLKAVTH